MIRASICTFFFCGGLFAQSPDTAPKFVAADIHPAVKSTGLTSRFFGGASVRAGRYEAKNATTIDLIRTAYRYQPDKILGGPTWLELDRFDVIAKLPEDSTPDTHNQMMQALLVDRFKLVVRKKTAQLTQWILIFLPPWSGRFSPSASGSNTISKNAR